MRREGNGRVCVACMCVCVHGYVSVFVSVPLSVYVRMRAGAHNYLSSSNTSFNNNVHLSCAHQCPERSHDTY